MVRAIGLLFLMSWLAAAGCGCRTSPPQSFPPLPFAKDEDDGPTAILVELSDFGEATAPKNDLLAEIGWFPGTGITGRPKLTLTRRLWLWIRRPSHAN